MPDDDGLELPAPRIAERGLLRVIGFAASCTFGDKSAIPRVWRKFAERRDELATPDAETVYGVSYEVNPDEGEFLYLAGVEASEDATLTEDMQEVLAPAGRYAVYLHRGNISGLPGLVRVIWDGGLAKADLQPRLEPELEIYDKRFDPETGDGDVEIWIPVV